MFPSSSISLQQSHEIKQPKGRNGILVPETHHCRCSWIYASSCYSRAKQKGYMSYHIVFQHSPVHKEILKIFKQLIYLKYSEFCHQALKIVTSKKKTGVEGDTQCICKIRGTLPARTNPVTLVLGHCKKT